MKPIIHHRALGIALFLTLPVTSQALTEVDATPSSFGVLQGEFQMNPTGPPIWRNNNNNADRAGAGGAGGDQRVNQPVWGFTLPSIGAGEEITEATFSFTTAGSAISSGANHTAVISLMTYDDIDDFSGADYVTDQTALGSGVLVATFDNTDLSNNTEISFDLEGAALTQLQSLYDASGNPTQTDIWFRISYDNFTWDWTINGNDRYQFADNGDGNVTRSLSITAIDPSTIAESLQVETAADGTGTVVPSQTLTAGDPAITVYSIARDATDTLIGNQEASWTLNVIDGDILPGDLVAAGDNLSAQFTPNGAGTAEITIIGAANNFVSSGIITVAIGPATTLSIETASDGSGAIVGDTLLRPTNTLDVFAILRDAGGNFIENDVFASFELVNKQGDVVDLDLSDNGNGSATFSAFDVGSTNIRVSSDGFTTVDSGLITVELLQNRWVSTGASGWITPAHWLEGELPAFDNTTDLYFYDESATKRNAYLQGNHTVRSLNYNESADANFNVRFTQSGTTGARNLTFDTDSETDPAEINVDADALGSFRLGNVENTTNEYGVTILADDLLITHNGLGTLIFDRPITEIEGPKNVTLAGFGVVSFRDVNSYTGTTSVLGGTLQVEGDSLDNSSALVIDGGLVQVTGTEYVASLQIGDGPVQTSGTFDAISNPAEISGTGSIVVGAPPSDDPIEITSIAKTGATEVTIEIVASGPVDVYRSNDLQSWGMAYAPNEPAGTYVDDAANEDKLFYLFVPAGEPGPDAP